MNNSPLSSDEMLDADDGYREWSETIELQAREQQDVEADRVQASEFRIIDLSRDTWPEVLTKLLPVADQ